jgi:capsular polysaccharide biosynthesis protein
MDFRDLLLALRRYWMVAAGVALLISAIGWSAAFLPQKTYRSVVTIVMDFSPNLEVSIQEVNFLLPALEQRAQSQRLTEAAESRVPDGLQNPHPTIDATIDASVLQIGATATSPAAAQAWANAAAEQLIEEREGVPPLALELLEPARLRVKPVSPNVLPILMATLVVALVASVFSALAAERAVSLYRQSFGRAGFDDEPDVPADPGEVPHGRPVAAARPVDAADPQHDDDDDDVAGDGAGDGNHVARPDTVGTARRRGRIRLMEATLVPETSDVAVRDDVTADAALDWGVDDRNERLRGLLVPMVAVGGLIVLAAVLTMALMLVRAL